MCNTRTITYACGHVLVFRLSTCRGTFTHEARKTKMIVSSCKNAALLTFKSTLNCGPCNRTEAETRLEKDMAEMRQRFGDNDWLSEPSPELLAAEETFEHEKWLTEREFPDGRFKKIARPEKGPKATRCGSILRQQIMPEDIVQTQAGTTSSNGGWDVEWDGEWKSLDDEIEELKAERMASGVPEMCWTLGGWSVSSETIVEEEVDEAHHVESEVLAQSDSDLEDLSTCVSSSEHPAEHCPPMTMTQASGNSAGIHEQMPHSAPVQSYLPPQGRLHQVENSQEKPKQAARSLESLHGYGRFTHELVVA